MSTPPHRPTAAPAPTAAPSSSASDDWEESYERTPFDPRDNPYLEAAARLAGAQDAPPEPGPVPDPAPGPATSAARLPAAMPEVEPEDRWTRRRMADFLRVLGAQQSVSAAARAVGMSRQSAYKLRNRLKGEPFDIAWEAAFQHGYDALHQAALERALHGIEVPVFHAGEQVGTRRHFDERLTVFLLSRRNAVGAQRLSRYGAAAEFWSERWETMLDHVENGPVVWLDEQGRPLRADDEKLSRDTMMRHALDEKEDRARSGGQR